MIYPGRLLNGRGTKAIPSSRHSASLVAWMERSGIQVLPGANSCTRNFWDSPGLP
jgi:hypothetical protein